MTNNVTFEIYCAFVLFVFVCTLRTNMVLVGRLMVKCLNLFKSVGLYMSVRPSICPSQRILNDTVIERGVIFTLFN